MIGALLQCCDNVRPLAEGILIGLGCGFVAAVSWIVISCRRRP